MLSVNHGYKEGERPDDLFCFSSARGALFVSEEPCIITLGLPTTKIMPEILMTLVGSEAFVVFSSKQLFRLVREGKYERW